MQRCHIAWWYDGLKRSLNARRPHAPHGEQHSSTRVSSWSRSMLQNCASRSGFPQTCSALDTPWNFRGATMAPLCSRIGLVGPLPKRRWRLSCTNRSYEWNRGWLIQTKLETPIKWKEASQFSSSYTMCHGSRIRYETKGFSRATQVSSIAKQAYCHLYMVQWLTTSSSAPSAIKYNYLHSPIPESIFTYSKLN